MCTASEQTSQLVAAAAAAAANALSAWQVQRCTSSHVLVTLPARHAATAHVLRACMLWQCSDLTSPQFGNAAAGMAYHLP
jgi:hypothetical protein